MNAITKTVLLTVALISVGTGSAQAAMTNFTFNGAFVFFDGYDPTFSNPTDVVNNGNGIAGDPVTGVMSIDFTTGAGSGTIFATRPFFGLPWHNNSMTMHVGPTGIVADMLISWGVPSNTPCGVVDCYMPVTDVFSFIQLDSTHYSLTTIDSTMGGPLAGYQPIFNGVLTAVPVPAAVWLLGSGLLGLVGIARRKAA